MVTSVQRFGGALNLHVHFHTLVLDDVFVREADGTLSFHAAAPPTDEAVQRVVVRVRRRLGADPNAPWVECHVPLHAREGGFDLHAAVHVAAGDRPRLTRLCRYLVRPPLGQQRLQQLRDRRIAMALQRPWADGTTHLVLTPTEFLERLVPLVPRRRMEPLCQRLVERAAGERCPTIGCLPSGALAPQGG